MSCIRGALVEIRRHTTGGETYGDWRRVPPLSCTLPCCACACSPDFGPQAVSRCYGVHCAMLWQVRLRCLKESAVPRDAGLGLSWKACFRRLFRCIMQRGNDKQGGGGRLTDCCTIHRGRTYRPVPGSTGVACCCISTTTAVLHYCAVLACTALDNTVLLYCIMYCTLVRTAVQRSTKNRKYSRL